MILSANIVIKLEIKFVEMCKEIGIFMNYESKYMKYQRIFVLSTLNALEVLYKQPVVVKHWTFAIENNRFIMPKREFDQIVLSLYNDEVNIETEIRNQRMEKRRKNKQKKLNEEAKRWGL